MTKPRRHEPLPRDDGQADGGQALLSALAGLGAEVGEGLRMLAEIHSGKSDELLRLAQLAEGFAGKRPADGHTGEVVVRIIPTGTPGFVRYTVASTGPVPLSSAEQARALRAAADQVEAGLYGYDADR